jgi:predicted ferric reductase
MIADLLNMLVGLWLTHAAIFPSALGLGDRFLLIAAILTIVLALWARRSDFSTWQSTTAIVSGVFLAILVLADQVMHVSDVLMFWGVLWTGLISATVSLWAALYRPSQAANVAE